jgi:hypothetical protein
LILDDLIDLLLKGTFIRSVASFCMPFGNAVMSVVLAQE